MTSADDPNLTLLQLPSDFLGCDVEALRQELLSALVRARPVELRGEHVARAGTASLQVLLAFLREAEQREVSVRIHSPSQPLLDALSTLGLRRLNEVQRALA